jgi:hypothetical protein
MEILSPSLPNNFFYRPQFASFTTKNPLKAANFLYKTKNQLNPDILNIITQCFNQLPHKSNKNEKPMDSSVSNRQNNNQT